MGKESKEDNWKDPSDMTLKEKAKFVLIRVLFSIVFGSVLMGIGIGIAFLISNHFEYSLQDTMFYEGVILLFIGIFASMKGSPSAGSVAGAGMRNAYQSIYYSNFEAERLNMEGKDPSKGFRSRSIVEFSRSSLNMILGGLLLAIVSQVFF